MKNRVIELDSQIESNRLTISKLEEHVKELEDEITEKLDQIQPLVKQKNLLLETDSSESNKMLLIESDIKESVIEINNNKKLLESISRKISEEAKFKGKDENCSEILRSKLEEIDQKTIVLNTEQANFNIQKSEYLNEKEQITVKLDDLSSQIDEKSRELKKTQDYIRRMENSKNNRLRLFDEKMPDVVAEIEKNRSFRFKPVGPAGIHIQLKDDHWVVPMNAIIGNDLEAFIVDNTDDSRLLRSILRKYNLNNPIIQLKFNDIDELDISKGRPQNDLLTALDVLNIDHLAVKKMLIMDCKIEKSVLITEYKEAMLVAKKKPVNVNAIFTEKYRIKFTANTTSTSAFYSNAQRPNFFTNIEKNINDAARIKTQLENWISESTNLAFELNANVTSLTSTINEIDLEIFARTRQLHDLRTKSREIQDKLVRNQDSGTTSIYEIEKSKALADLKICEEEKMRLDQQYDRIKENISTSQNQIYQLDLQIKSIESSHRRTLAQLSDIEKQKTVLFRENDKVTREVEKISSAVLTSLASEAKITEELAEMVQQASSMYPRTVVSSTIEDIDKELQFQQDCVRNKELYSKIDPESLKTEYYHLVEQRRNEERGIIENGDLITKLELSIKERLDSWHYFRKCVSKQSAIDFIMLLNPRGYNGSLEYKHQESELHITIIPPSQQQAIRTSFSKNIYKKPKKDKKMLNRLSQKQFVEKHDVKQLSGGEKSYGTGCFLCSLWSAIGSPTRCLDEFDVFMVSIKIRNVK